jgi:hypothetical protein
MSYLKGFGSGSNSNGQFWYGNTTNFPGFLYKKNTGVGGRKNPKYGLICNKPTYLYNKYKPGTGGIGASSVANRRAKNRIASVCNNNNCGKFYTYLGRYNKFLYNPNGYFVYPQPIITPNTEPDGRYQSIVSLYGNVYNSSDYGNTWVKTTILDTNLIENVITKGTNNPLYSTTLNVSKVLISNIVYNYKNNVWTLANTQPDLINRENQITIAASYDCKYQTIVNYDDNLNIIFVSDDYGNNWKTININFNKTVTISCDSTGQHQLITTLDETSQGQPYSFIYYSSNYGNNWINISTIYKYTYYCSNCISGDNSVWVLGDYYGNIYYSYNSGETWDVSVINPYDSSPFGVIKSSYDGNIMVAICNYYHNIGGIKPYGYLYVSYDKGKTWNASSILGETYWISVDISYSGSCITALSTDTAKVVKYYNQSLDGGKTWRIVNFSNLFGDDVLMSVAVK